MTSKVIANEPEKIDFNKTQILQSPGGTIILNKNLQWAVVLVVDPHDSYIGKRDFCEVFHNGNPLPKDIDWIVLKDITINFSV